MDSAANDGAVLQSQYDESEIGDIHSTIVTIITVHRSVPAIMFFRSECFHVFAVLYRENGSTGPFRTLNRSPEHGNHVFFPNRRCTTEEGHFEIGGMRRARGFDLIVQNINPPSNCSTATRGSTDTRRVSKHFNIAKNRICRVGCSFRVSHYTLRRTRLVQHESRLG